MKDYRILYITNSDGIGGAEVLLKEICKKCKFLCKILILWKSKNPGNWLWNEIPNKVIFLNPHHLSFKTILKIFFSLKNFLKREEIQIVHTNLKGADILIGLLLFFKLIRKDWKLYTTIHNSYSYYYQGSFFNRLIGLIHKFLLKQFWDGIILVSKQDIELFRKTFKNKKLIVIENGIDINMYKPKTQWSLESETIKIAMVGNVKKRKGYLKLIDLFKYLPKHKKYIIDIAGIIEDLEIKEGILSEVCKYPHIKVNFVGRINNINEFLIHHDIFLSLSEEEGLPISVLEAIATKIPILLTNIKAHKVLVKPSLRKLVLFNNIQECSYLMEYLLQNAEIIVEEQYEFLKKHFSLQKVCTSLEALYNEIL